MTTLPFRIRSFVALFLALAMLAARPAPAPAQANGQWRFFNETGCWVGNEFLDFYDRRGGLDLFGYPIDNAAIEDGLTVQYFQRARMELHPEAPAAYRVQLGLLGQALLGRIDPPVTHDRLPSPGDRNHEYFPETGQVVSYAFLEYYRTRGGVDIFGYPISAQTTENGVVVQYFQRARLEWRPANPERYRVQPGLIGMEYYMRRYGQRPVPSPSPSGSPTAAPTPPAVTAATATAGRAPALVSPGATTAPPTSPSPTAAAAQADPLTISHLIMFVVTFAVVVLVGLALLWKRGSLHDWLAKRGTRPPGSGADSSAPWTPGS